MEDKVTHVVADLTDQELVVRAIDNPEYFGHIIDRYEQKLHRYVRSISGASFDDREDLLQEIFLSVYQNLAGYNKKLKFSSWIYRIAHNKTISWWRKHKKEATNVSIDEHLSFVESVYNDDSISREHEQEHIRLASEYALESMKEQYRQILVLKFWQGRSYEEIADIMGSSVGTVGTRVARAKKQFITLFNTYEQS